MIQVTQFDDHTMHSTPTRPVNFNFVQELMQTVSSSNVAKYVNNKKTLYLACARNGYLLPPERDPIVTFDFLDSVRVGLIWLPKTHECVGKYLDKLNEFWCI